MKKLSFLFTILCLTLPFICEAAIAQTITVHFNIAPEQDTFLISPYIYGSNGQSDDSTANITSRRAGGNRWTGYNWETNASNAGTDYLNQSDDYFSYLLPANERLSPGSAAIDFQQQSQSVHAYTLGTLPTAGYVAADESGVVDATQTAPSSRWRTVVFAKDAAFSMPPDTTDGYIFVDEEVNYLKQMLAMKSGRIEGYDCDNEPALWPATHPRIHPNATTCAEVISKDSALALAVKAVDPQAEIFGPVSYGFEEYLNNQQASDWQKYSLKYDRWIDAYLANMHAAEIANGKRLLDVLDLHWYPNAQGKSSTGQLVEVDNNDDADPGIARARMDAPRTLWDSSYTENSWIGLNYSPVALLSWLNASIAKYYPGTKLSFSEFDYGGEHQISGAIATADVFGIFGKYHVYMSNHWGTVDSYLASAYKIYRNYDGNNSAYGDIGVHATTDAIDSTSIYAARRTNDAGHLDIIAINKSENATASATIALTSSTTYSSARAFMLQQTSPTITEGAPVSAIQNNTFTYSLPPLSITHFVLAGTTSSVASAQSISPWRILSAVSVSNGVKINFAGILGSKLDITLQDVLGRTRFESSVSSDALSQGSMLLPVANLTEGAYFITVRSGGYAASYKLIAGIKN